MTTVTNSSKPQRIRADWSARHHPVHAVLNVGIWVMVGAGVASMVGIDWWWILAAAVLIGLATGLVGVTQELAGGVLIYRISSCLAAGVWSAWAVATGGIWRPIVGLVFVVLLVAMAITGTAFAASRRKQEKTQEQIAAEQEAKQTKQLLEKFGPRADFATEWIDRINRITRIDPKLTLDNVIGVKDWGKDAGHTIELQLPAGGHGAETLALHERALANDADLPPGAGVEIGEGASRRRVLVRVGTRDAIRDDIPYGTDYPLRSINDDIDFMVHRDYTTPTICLRQKSVLMTGDTGSGKTSGLDATVGWFSETVDVVPLMIDYNGGGVAMPWLIAWRANLDKVKRPPVAAVAGDPKEAEKLTAWLLATLLDRKETAAYRKVAANTTLLPLDRELPFYALVVDEFAELVRKALKDPGGPAGKTLSNIESINELGRDAGARLVLTSLTADSSSTGSRKIQALTDVRVGFKADARELGYLFDEWKLDPKDTPYAGTAFVSWDKRRPRPVRYRYLRPTDRAALLIGTDERRCPVDERAMQINGGYMADWWNSDAGRLLIAKADRQVAAAQAAQNGEKPAAVPPPAPTTTSSPERKDTTVSTDGSAMDAMAQSQKDLDASMDEARRVADAVDQQREQAKRAGGDETEARARAAMARELTGIAPGFALPDADEPQPRIGTPPPPAEPKVERPEPRERYRQLLQEAGATGTGATAIFRQMRTEGYPTTRPTIQEWLGADTAKGIVTKLDNGRYAIRGGAR